MEDESGTVDVMAMGETMSIDYGVLIAINSTSNGNCTKGYKNGCSPREKLHFRFWPGEISPSQTSQGLMALTVMLILLCLVLTYCCWGTCCKLIQKRRSRNTRSRSQASFDSSISCASDPRLMMMWSPRHHREVCAHHPDSSLVCEQHRNHLLVKPRLLRSEIHPPPYDTLFGQENTCAPPTYSSLALSQPMYPANLCSENHGHVVSTSGPFVTVVVEREEDVSDAAEEIQQGSRILRCQSVPALVDSSSRNKQFAVHFRTENLESETLEQHHENN